MNEYEIFDANRPLMTEIPNIQANTNIEAAIEYCRQHYPKQKPVRSGGKFVSVMIKKIGGRAVWYLLNEH